MRRLHPLPLLVACTLIGPVAASVTLAASAPPSPSPRNEPLHSMAIPAKVTLIAWLPVFKQPDWIDVDVRIAVVVPYSCGDRLAGIMRAGGARLDGPDAWDVVTEHRPAPDCTPSPTRMSNRYTVRMKVPDGQTRDLSIGPSIMKVARHGQTVTLDGVPPEGDVPGAPGTARPITLVTSEPSSVKLISAERDSNDIDSARVVVQLTTTWPGCFMPPLGLLAKGDASTRFALSKYVALAPVPLDQPCKVKSAVGTHELSTLVRLPKGKNETRITVGKAPLTIKVGPRPAQGPQAPTPTAAQPAPQSCGTPDTAHAKLPK